MTCIEGWEPHSYIDIGAGNGGSETSYHRFSIDATATRCVVFASDSESPFFYGLRVFVRDGTTWTLEQSIADAEVDDLGAIMMSSDGSRFLVDASRASDGLSVLRWYSRSGATWSHEKDVVPYYDWGSGAVNLDNLWFSVIGADDDLDIVSVTDSDRTTGKSVLWIYDNGSVQTIENSTTSNYDWCSHVSPDGSTIFWEAGFSALSGNATFYSNYYSSTLQHYSGDVSIVKKSGGTWAVDSIAERDQTILNSKPILAYMGWIGDISCSADGSRWVKSQVNTNYHYEFQGNDSATWRLISITSCGAVFMFIDNEMQDIIMNPIVPVGSETVRGDSSIMFGHSVDMTPDGSKLVVGSQYQETGHFLEQAGNTYTVSKNFDQGDSWEIMENLPALYSYGYARDMRITDDGNLIGALWRELEKETGDYGVYAYVVFYSSC